MSFSVHCMAFQEHWELILVFFAMLKKKQMQLCLTSQPVFQERTLATLKAEYEKFTAAGSVLSKAK